MLAINRLKTTLIASLLLLAGAAANTMAQQPRVQSTASEFSFEILYPNGRRTVLTIADAPGRSGYSFHNDLTRIADWKPSDEVPSETAVLRLQVWLEERVPQIEIFAYLGKATPQARMEEWEKLPKVKVLTRALLLDETVTISDTERFGIVPFKLRAFKAQPWSIGPPTVTNKTAALTITSLTESRPHYRVAVKNLSHTPISGIRWYGLENGRRGGGSGMSGPLVIPSGGSFEIRQHFGFAEAPMMRDATNWRPPTREIVIAAILFHDGSYEGEPDEAVEMAANKAGERFQLERAARLWRNLSVTPASEQATVAVRLKGEISALSEEAPTEVVDELITRFSVASQDMRNRRIRHHVSNGLRFVKNHLRSEIERYEVLRESAPADANFEELLENLERAVN